MAIPISKWLLKRYSILWEKYKEDKMDLDDIIKALKEKDNKTVSVILSELNRNGWIIVEKSGDDKRKSVYQLKKPENIVESIAES